MKLIWDITNKCNLNCKHCYNPDQFSQELSTDEVKKVIDKTIDHVEFYQFLGGEPFFRNDIFEIFDYLTEKNAPFVVITNGTLLDEAAVERLGNTNIREIGISLDSSSAKENDFIRGKGVFQKACKTIELLNKLPEEKKIKVHISVTVSKLSLDQYEEFLKFAEQNNIYSILFVPVEISGNALTYSDDLKITSVEWISFLENLCNVSDSYQVKINFPGTPILKGYLAKKYGYKSIKRRSLNYENQIFRNIYLRANGDIFPTFKIENLPSIGGVNIIDLDMGNLLNTESFKDYFDYLQENKDSATDDMEICQRCKFNKECTKNLFDYLVNKKYMQDTCCKILLAYARSNKII